MPTCRIRLPRTSQRRGDFTFLTLIERVYPGRAWGNAFEGPVFRPGATVDESSLWPAPDSPRVPLLLEFAGHPVPGWGHRRTPVLHVLWRYNAAAGQFEEVLRVTGLGLEWVPIVRDAVTTEFAAVPRPSGEDADAAAARVFQLVQREAELLPAPERNLFFGILHEQILGRSLAAHA